MNVNQMREVLRSYYGSGSPFAAKLKYMRSEQIAAIYFRLKNKGALK